MSTCPAARPAPRRCSKASCCSRNASSTRTWPSAGEEIRLSSADNEGQTPEDEPPTAAGPPPAGAPPAEPAAEAPAAEPEAAAEPEPEPDPVRQPMLDALQREL